MNKKNLPIGYSSLIEIINDNCVYVDKTKFVYQLVSTGKYYFLSRPRRFGKSLLLDTLKQAFLGNKKLFAGLYLENNWDWDKVYPVIHINFAEGEIKTTEALAVKIVDLINLNAKKYAIQLSSTSISSKFRELISLMAEKYEQNVVILIDEYDKPILDNITNPEVATQMRDGLKDLYSVIKACDNYLKFVFLTGVSKFSKVSLFSDLNNLNDISLTASYADICGYTQSELLQQFKPYLGDVDLDKLKLWYNGYNFAGTPKQKVYNPFDILLFIDKDKQYKNYWFETGTPTFLVKLIEKHQYYIPDLESVVVGESDLATFDVDNMSIYTLLFQSGHLTIKSITAMGNQIAYELSYPNLEIKSSLNDSLAVIGTTVEHKSRNLFTLSKILYSDNMDGLAMVFESHFASIPNAWYRNNNIAHYEGFYSSVVYSYFCALGFKVIAEDTTNQGQIDLVIKTDNKILIVEFKLSKYGNALAAITQIKTKGYAQKYTADCMPIYLIGISFNANNRNIFDYTWELYN